MGMKKRKIKIIKRKLDKIEIEVRIRVMKYIKEKKKRIFKKRKIYKKIKEERRKMCKIIKIRKKKMG